MGNNRYLHNHGRRDWGIGRKSISSAETIWSVLKGGIKKKI